MKVACISLVLAFVLTSCQSQSSVDTGKPIPSNAENASSRSTSGQPIQQSAIVPNKAKQTSYENKKYEYQLTYPTDRMELLAYDEEQFAITKATPESDVIMIRSQKEPTRMFQIKGISSGSSPKAWLENELRNKNFMGNDFDMSTSLQWIKDTTFADQPAAEARGESKMGSLYRILVLRKGSYLLVLTQSSDDPMLNSVMESFTLAATNS